MSLFDYLNNDATASTSSSVSQQMQLLIQQATARQGAATPASSAATGNNATDAVSISVDAVRAAAIQRDAGADGASLAQSLREAFDQVNQAAGAKDSANLAVLSPRALSIVALNEDGKFTKSEAAAARHELRERDRQAALSLIRSGDLTAASLIAYGKEQLAARNTMSAEELRLRETDPDLS